MAYEQQDEGYSEDPLTVGTSTGLPGSTSWLQALPIPQRTGRQRYSYDNDRTITKN